jgi:hypothetical protein
MNREKNLCLHTENRAKLGQQQIFAELAVEWMCGGEKLKKEIMNGSSKMHVKASRFVETDRS